MNNRISPGFCWQATALLAIGLMIPGGCRERIAKTREEQLRNMPTVNREALEVMQNTPLIMAGLEAPQFVSPIEAGLAFETPVVGVVVDDQPRAYPVSKLSTSVSHVVNDVVVTSAGVRQPITVTYCDMTDCIRVLTAPESEGSLGIGTLGLLQGGLALHWGKRHFKQTAEVVGLEDVPFERVAWGEWRRRYPETLVFRGSGINSPASAFGRWRNPPVAPPDAGLEQTPIFLQQPDHASR